MKAATTPSPSQQKQEAGLGDNTTHLKNVEIERKWIVETLPDLTGLKRLHINQGYLAIEKSGDEVRLRQCGDTLLQTVKRGSGLVRAEIETPLTQEQFDTLWPATEGRRVEKLRVHVPHGDVTIEVDIYGGSLAGLIVAEVEFPSIEAAMRFSPPAWLREEVTQNERYKNRSLALYGQP